MIKLSTWGREGVKNTQKLIHIVYRWPPTKMIKDFQKILLIFSDLLNILRLPFDTTILKRGKLETNSIQGAKSVESWFPLL